VIEIDLSGDQNIGKHLGMIADKLDDTRPLMATLARHAKSRVLLGFMTGTDPYGAPWKKPKHRSGQPLRDTGNLRNNFNTRADENTAQVGTNVKYAPIHQFGFKGPETVKAHIRMITQAFGHPVSPPKPVHVKAHTRFMDMPARPFLPEPAKGLPNAWRQDFLTVIEGYLQ